MPPYLLIINIDGYDLPFSLPLPIKDCSLDCQEKRSPPRQKESHRMTEFETLPLPLSPEGCVIINERPPPLRDGTDGQVMKL
jgi:hypothetical protein